VYLPFNGSNSPAYQTRIQTEYDYGWRDSSAPSSNVKTIAKANSRAARYLDDNSTEDDRITCILKLPASLVTGIKQGQRVQAKFSHLPNGSNAVWGDAFAWLRVLNRTVMANEQTNVLYNVKLELSPPPAGPFMFHGVMIVEGDSGTPIFTSGVSQLYTPVQVAPAGTWLPNTLYYYKFTATRTTGTHYCVQWSLHFGTWNVPGHFDDIPLFEIYDPPAWEFNAGPMTLSGSFTSHPAGVAPWYIDYSEPLAAILEYAIDGHEHPNQYTIEWWMSTEPIP
jgi:hypothetical protein